MVCQYYCCDFWAMLRRAWKSSVLGSQFVIWMSLCARATTKGIYGLFLHSLVDSLLKKQFIPSLFSSILLIPNCPFIEIPLQHYPSAVCTLGSSPTELVTSRRNIQVLEQVMLHQLDKLERLFLFVIGLIISYTRFKFSQSRNVQTYKMP